MKEILEIIKNQRKIKKISQEEMALKIGIARTSYQAIELGKSKSISSSSIEKHEQE